MTIKEAIDYLNRLRDEVWNEDSDGYEYAKAIDVAIEALNFQRTLEAYAHDMGVSLEQAERELRVDELSCSEEPNRSDTIYRQDAIDALDVLCQEYRYKIPGKRETYSQYNEAWQDALGRAEGAIGNLPSAQPEIIRCKECEHWDTSWQNDYAPNYHYCPLVDGARRDDFYCADAERRADDRFNQQTGGD